MRRVWQVRVGEAGSGAIGQTVAMAMATVNRRWMIATWLLARVDDRLHTVAEALTEPAPDAIVLQSIGEQPAADLAASLGVHHRWAKSHHPRSRLIPGSAIGLALLTPHHIGASSGQPIGDTQSLWSPRRRVAQTVVVERADHSAHTIAHAVERLDEAALPTGSAPLVRVRPAQVGHDDRRAIQIPMGATLLASNATRPIDDIAELLSVTFEMPWVQGDFTPGPSA